jgi:hypothetical protein
VFGDLGDDGVSTHRNQPGGSPINVSIITTGGLHRPVDLITPCTRSAIERLDRFPIPAKVKPQP